MCVFGRNADMPATCRYFRQKVRRELPKLEAENVTIETAPATAEKEAA